MAYKMVFSDMDGTLLHKGIRLSVENKEAIRRTVDKGVDFVICTGRAVFGVERFLEELGLIGKKGYVICQNGAALYALKDMRLVQKKAFSPEKMLPVAKLARELGLEMFYYDDRNFMVETVTDMVREYAQMMGTELRVVQEPTDYKGEFTKCLVSGKKEVLMQLREKIRPYLGEELHTFFSSDIYMEIVRCDVSKGDALEAAAKEAGVALADTIAIGDSENDLSMILRAGLGVAMHNGDEIVKAAAGYVTERNCEENGVAEVLEKFVLQQ